MRNLCLITRKYYFKVKNIGVPWWFSGLRIQCRHCCGSGMLIPGLGTSASCRHSQKISKQYFLEVLSIAVYKLKVSGATPDLVMVTSQIGLGWWVCISRVCVVFRRMDEWCLFTQMQSPICLLMAPCIFCKIAGSFRWKKKKDKPGVPFMAQQTRIQLVHEDMGSTTGLAQWVSDLPLLWAVM